jgi:hypothetical protein
MRRRIDNRFRGHSQIKKPVSCCIRIVIHLKFGTKSKDTQAVGFGKDVLSRFKIKVIILPLESGPVKVILSGYGFRTAPPAGDFLRMGNGKNTTDYQNTEK